MLNIPVTCVLLAMIALGGCATAQPPSSVPASTVESTVLLKSSRSWDGTAYDAYPVGKPELTVLNIKIPANTALNWHEHPMPNAAYVLSGNLTVETREGGKSILLKPGDVLPEMVNREHRGLTGNTAVELVVFYAGTPGMPLSTRQSVKQ
ncbi:cupin domain-containing protein [Pseudomonas sp. NPDC078416]|uniref:cupin domain-containing protein n=1 Tax=Pseudomonas sp. NPDC078416 TaxID=3390637 RepID=UPI003CFC28A3